MKRICDKIAGKRLERHRGMAIRNCQTSRIVYTHKHSLSRREACGVRGILNTWFKSYLSGRSQYVSLTQTDNSNKVLHTYSSSLRINLNGVPQGSILGPLLFLIYI